MLIIPGAISQRGINRTPDEAAINISVKTSRKNNAGFLRKHKAKVNNETRKQITKLLTYGMEIPEDKKKESLCGC